MTRRRMPTVVRDALTAELEAASRATTPGDRWQALERAHILSQPWAWPHTVCHWRMLGLAVRQRNRSEALGQVIRLVVAAPGSLSGRYPEGNTGRASAGLTTPMPIPDDLAAIIDASTDR